MIRINNLCFSYTKKTFINNVSFSVNKGEIFGFLGPSGAGKSTLQKIMIGLLPKYQGSVLVNNVEVRNITNDFYEHIGVDFEYPSLYERLTAKQNLSFFVNLYKNKAYDIDALLASVGLLNDKDRKISSFSKGMKSRINFLKSIIHNPDILFLDEPTSGLDPANSRLMKNMILEQKRLGKTIILTTHNMSDAEELCDRVAFIVDGEIKAIDTPHNLIMKKKEILLAYTYLENGEEIKREVPLSSSASDEKLSSLIKENALLTIHSKEPNLGDIFIEITGRKLL